MGTHPIFESDFDCLTQKTKDSVDDFNADFKTFLAMINDFSTQADAMAEQVKQRKLKAIGTRTQLQAIERQNMSKKNQLLQRIQENQALLERLRAEHDALKRVEQDQHTVLQQMNA